ncbi:NAD(P)H dehydrogenase [Photobacterium proteolyticum]|uniref:NAD(P)H dehydrogenase n=1 Tax=Photobacterium proteolyticum TaxID=1903952 RepID=A0A1Q9G875_9GAMM|nr:NAD(P)H-dependent oxidoreductase [Photobacterium proteolyticum]OLQ70537.1 NAD(P)H dehydrogenase [Photobacterium proteolyticum]
MSRKILVINGNPKANSFCHELTEQYVLSSRNKHQVKVLALSELTFEPDLHHGYDENQPLEADLSEFQSLLKWAEHVVFIFPVWWGGMPAKLKGLIDRTFLSGFAFNYQEGKMTPDKLLSGRSADIILTMDTPPLYYRWIQGNPVYKQLKRTVLEFCGIKVGSPTYIGPVISSSEQQREKWSKQVSALAAKL